MTLGQIKKIVMYIPLSILIIMLWSVGVSFCWYKQNKCTNNESKVFIVVLLIIWPLWLIGAIIRQVFIEDWK